MSIRLNKCIEEKDFGDSVLFLANIEKKANNFIRCFMNELIWIKYWKYRNKNYKKGNDVLILHKNIFYLNTSYIKLIILE